MKRLLIVLLLFVLTVSAFLTDDVEAKNSSRKATILYFNDAHEVGPVVNENEDGDRGGVAKLKTAIDHVREENKHTLVAFGGDLGGGTLFGGVYQGFPVVEAFNRIDIDLANFGQHDFDFGSHVTKELVEESDFPWISSNLTDAEGSPFAGVSTYKIFNERGIKMGVIGLTDNMNTTTADDQVEQQDIIQSAQNAVAQMKETKKVDVIIALTQENLAKDKQLLSAVPEIDAVFTEEKAEYQSFVYEYDNRYIFAPAGNIGSMIRLDIHKKGKDIQLIPEIIEVDHTVPEDPELKEFADYYEDKLEGDLGQSIAQLETPLINQESRYQETNIGNFVADSYRSYFNADIGFMNGGGIRTSVPAGEFTLRDAYSILPFRNKVILATVPGDTIRAALENGVSNVENLGGGFLQVSGLKYSYQRNNPEGSRVDNILVNKEPLDLQKDYTVAMPNYLFNGGDGFTMFSQSMLVVDETNARTDAEVLIEYAEKSEVIHETIDGRITVFNE
ncbi:5'-nucleotidase [Gracilibacillus orientalis]|uniref:5'-nucleotidase n=1 Tax=Gracilibacillus orientalis TaxID=334253 RepID=A0A1I4K2P8_9BACI|nr:5'-nucleotidase C-terminal domain-containing protein [Gracilibacillus orientalis]SFL73012.1 5'-nucleotidase [Gracilibacillus orientalis]